MVELAASGTATFEGLAEAIVHEGELNFEPGKPIYSLEYDLLNGVRRSFSLPNLFNLVCIEISESPVGLVDYNTQGTLVFLEVVRRVVRYVADLAFNKDVPEA